MDVLTAKPKRGFTKLVTVKRHLTMRKFSNPPGARFKTFYMLQNVGMKQQRADPIRAEHFTFLENVLCSKGYFTKVGVTLVHTRGLHLPPMGIVLLFGMMPCV